MIKSRSLRWAGHVELRGEEKRIRSYFWEFYVGDHLKDLGQH